MKILKKVTVGLGISLILGSVNLSASTYIVQKGDTLSHIAYKLGFDSIKKAKFSVPSGDINLIHPGEVLNYTKKHRRIFVKKNKIDLKKFCFKDAKSIHYRAEERCK